MEDERTIPFAGTPIQPGRILVDIDPDDEEGDASVWVLEEDVGDGGWRCQCPFERHRTAILTVEPSTPDTWVGPDLQSVLSYLKLMGIKAI